MWLWASVATVPSLLMQNNVTWGRTRGGEAWRWCSVCHCSEIQIRAGNDIVVAGQWARFRGVDSHVLRLFTVTVQEVPEPYPLSTDSPIVQAAGGWAHCVAVTGISSLFYLTLYILPSILILFYFYTLHSNNNLHIHPLGLYEHTRFVWICVFILFRGAGLQQNDPWLVKACCE